MLFIWDSRKAAQNVRKHGVSFDIAQTVFGDPLHLSIADERSKGEQRWVTIGEAANGRTLVIAHTYFVGEGGHGMIRIISARKATRGEVKQYEERI